MSRNPRLDAFFSGATRWREEMERLRAVVLGCPLTEELKWRQPCYTFGGSNVAIISAFNAYCVLGFFKGALLKDPEGILVPPGENSYVGRQIRFTDVAQVAELEPVVRAYLNEAIDVERAGLKVDTSKRPGLAPPDELVTTFSQRPEVKAAFEALTPGRQRAYLLHFTAAKKSATRTSRIEKYIPRILDGKGLRDR
jgi:uncharacterized protein YdeI (YjbR/CyaY-like superfamily)